MPAKRTYGESLTGGTGDVNPQTYTISVDLGAVTGTGTVGFPLPIPRYPGSKNRAIVMELLKVEWYLDSIVPSAATGDNYAITAGLTTAAAIPGGQAAIVQDARNLSIIRRQYQTLTATAVGFQIFNPVLEEVDDLTDKAGHGVLVATDNIYVRWSQNVLNYTPADTMTAKLTYRMKEIGLTEYIGIVQSQQ